MKRSKRDMRTVQVQLDMNKDDQAQLYEIIDEIKQARQFTQVFMDAMRLIIDLQDGSTEVLFELFPELEHELSSSDGGELDDIRERLRRLEDERMAAYTHPSRRPDTEYQMVEQPLPPLPPAVQMKPPAADFGTKLTVERKTNGESDGSAADNLLNSLANF